VLISNATGEATAYSLFYLQDRGAMMIDPQTRVYEGMIIGQHTRDNDLVVNIIQGKKLSNVRAAGKDENMILTPPMRLTLERALSYIEDDELVEVTPKSIRLRKRWPASTAAGSIRQVAEACPQQPLQVCRLPCDLQRLQPRLAARGHVHAAPGDAQPIGQQRFHGAVGRALVGNGAHPHLEGGSVDTIGHPLDAIARRSGRDAHKHLQPALSRPPGS
jgi:hypothetical protein